jgi:hypothetical protein
LGRRKATMSTTMEAMNSTTAKTTSSVPTHYPSVPTAVERMWALS